jgi:hypothetical protein
MGSNMKQVEEVLRQAAEAVANAGIPDDLRAAAFERAVELIAGTTPTDQAGAPPSSARGPEVAGTPIETIATKLKLDTELVGEAFHVDDNGELRLSFGPSKLEHQKSKATKQIALLLAAGRQGSGQEEWTETRTIRDAVQDFGKHDQANFATTITEMDDFFSMSGSGQSRKVKLNRTGFEEASKLIQQIRGV